MKKSIRERLQLGPILCDGAIGTLLDLYEYPELPHEIQNIKNPDIIERIHHEYIDAGSEIIKTNTFSANRIRLSQFHLEEQIKEINLKGVEIACKVAKEKNVYVAASIGPTGMMLEPIGKLKKEIARNCFKEQIEILVSQKVDLLMFETFVSVSELDEAIFAAKELGVDIPIVAQKAFAEDASILSGNFPIEVFEHLLSLGVDVVGANCTVGPQRMYSIIKNVYKDGIILSAQPSAGIPTLLNGRSIYHATPEYLSQYAKELVESGVTLIGACCGSTPKHIKEMKKAIDDIIVSKIKIIEKEKPKQEKIVLQTNSKKSNFANKIGKKFITTVELDIPRGLDMNSVISGAKFLHNIGIDAVNITDGARARLRMNAVALSYKIQSEVGIETITHQTARDRNLIGIQSELLGAELLGIKNILCITGDPTQIGDYPQSQSVFDTDSIGLIRALRSMNEGYDLSGNTLGTKTNFLICAAANPTSQNFEYEVERVAKKIEYGAEVIFTQPIYEIKAIEKFVESTRQFKIPIIIGILPLQSYKHADFLHNEIPGMKISESIRNKIKQSSIPSQTGIEISKEIIKEIKNIVDGIYIMPPFKKYYIVEQLLEAIE